MNRKVALVIVTLVTGSNAVFGLVALVKLLMLGLDPFLFLLAAILVIINGVIFGGALRNCLSEFGHKGS
jgi:hypothetical protein